MIPGIVEASRWLPSFSDTFNRANAASLATTNLDWVDIVGDWDIASNTAYSATTAASYPLAAIESLRHDVTVTASMLARDPTLSVPPAYVGVPTAVMFPAQAAVTPSIPGADFGSPAVTATDPPVGNADSAPVQCIAAVSVSVIAVKPKFTSTGAAVTGVTVTLVMLIAVTVDAA
jgi:hypothetical protein